MAMEVQGRRQDGVKVKFIETQFISSDAASFKAVVQRLTGKSSSASPPVAPQPQRPRPCRPAALASGGGNSAHQLAAGWAEQQAAGGHLTVPAPKQEAALGAPLRMEELYELCDFADLLYATAGARRDDSSGGFPY